MLVLRCDLSGRPGFKDVLARTREMAFQAYAHQDVPFEHLVEVLDPGRDLSRSPLFQVVFAMQNTPREAVKIDAVEMSPLVMDGGETVARYDLTLNMGEGAAGLVGGLEFCTDLFSRDTIDNLLAQYVGLLEQIVKNPELPIDEYEVATEWDEHAYGSCSHSIGEPGGNPLSVDELPATHIVLADESGEHSVAELSRRAGRVANWLTSQGVVAGQCIGLVEGASADTLVSWLALNKLGATAYFMPPGLNALRQRFLCSSAGVERILDAALASDDTSDVHVGDPQHSHPQQCRSGLRVHLRHASGKLLAAQWDHEALLSRLLAHPNDDLVADPVWMICGLTPRIVSMLRALARGERWDSTRHRAPSDVSHLPALILEGKRLAPIGTPGELCLPGLRLLDRSGSWTADHPLVNGSRLVKTGHWAILDKHGGCRLLSAWGADASRFERRLARHSEELLQSECEGETLALVRGRGQWTMFADRKCNAIARLKRDSAPQLRLSQ